MINHRPLRLYLDSSDYSVLSNQRNLSIDLENTRRRLQAWVERGSVVVYFSQTLLAEMAPIAHGAEQHAQARAELLFNLCGRNALLATDRLITFELSKLLEKETLTPAGPYSFDGTWYGSGADELPQPFTPHDIEKMALEEIGSMTSNRRQRRQASRVVKRNRTALHAQAQSQARSLTLSDEQIKRALKGYPLKREDFTSVMRYLASGERANAAREAYRRSLSDPRWILEWMYTDIDQSRDFANMIREPGLRLCQQMEACVVTADRVRTRTDSSAASEHLSGKFPYDWIIRQIEHVAGTLAKRALGYGKPISAAQIKDACPGIYATLGAFYSAWRGSMERNRDRPKHSDYGDALHALYAPYVDIFRADSSMTPHVSRYAPSTTCVVGKLTQIVPTIERLLSQGQ